MHGVEGNHRQWVSEDVETVVFNTIRFSLLKLQDIARKQRDVTLTNILEHSKQIN